MLPSAQHTPQRPPRGSYQGFHVVGMQNQGPPAHKIRAQEQAVLHTIRTGVYKPFFALEQPSSSPRSGWHSMPARPCRLHKDDVKSKIKTKERSVGLGRQPSTLMQPPSREVVSAAVGCLLKANDSLTRRSAALVMAADLNLSRCDHIKVKESQQNIW
jgi:hypothetical protein